MLIQADLFSGTVGTFKRIIPLIQEDSELRDCVVLIYLNCTILDEYNFNWKA